MPSSGLWDHTVAWLLIFLKIVHSGYKRKSEKEKVREGGREERRKKLEETAKRIPLGPRARRREKQEGKRK